MIYLDSSALAKRYVAEEGTAEVRDIIDNATLVTTSRLTYPEILSVFNRKHRDREISEGDFSRVVNEFETDWEYFLIIELRDELMPIIKKIVRKYRLRGADSVHLSSALWMKHISQKDVTFVASDANLLKAAEPEKLKVINPLK